MVQKKALNMVLKLRPRKRRCWEKRWKIVKPVLYVLGYSGDDLVQSWWWSGNWKDSERIRFENSGTVNISSGMIYLGDYRYLTKLKVVGNTGTNLIIKRINSEKTEIVKTVKGHPGNLPGFTVFGEINPVSGMFEIKRENCKELI